MKNLKKHPRKQLEKFSTVFMQLGLVLTLFVVYVVIEHQSKIKTPTAFVHEPDDKPHEIDFTIPVIFKEVEIPKPKEKLPEPKTSNNLSEIDKVDNKDKVIETVIDKPVDIKPQVVNPDDIVEAPEDPIIDPNDDPKNILFVEEVPIYRGCEGLSKNESRKCLDKKLAKHVQKYFNGNIGEDIGLRSGKHKMYAQFVIDKRGNIIDIKVNSAYKKLQIEASRVVKKIPQFTPGKQQGKPVKVKYTLPITFYVQ